MRASADVVRIELPSESAALRAVRGALLDFAFNAALPLAARELDEVAIALQEACTNAIRHAHGCDPTKRFRVELRSGDESLEILVKDGGAPFDLDAVAAPKPEELREGGYGIAIMRSWMDEVGLSREDGGNVLRLVRKYRARDEGDGGRAD